MKSLLAVAALFCIVSCTQEKEKESDDSFRNWGKSTPVAPAPKPGQLFGKSNPLLEYPAKRGR